MKKKSFSATSKARLETCHPDIQLVMNESLNVCPVDFGIAEGNRAVEKQQQYFREGKSRIDGITKKGKHNFLPSEAVDVYAYYNGKAQWDINHLCLIAGVVLSTAERLFAEGKISHRFRWGGNWDMDGVILLDQKFDDGPHYEILD